MANEYVIAIEEKQSYPVIAFEEKQSFPVDEPDFFKKSTSGITKKQGSCLPCHQLLKLCII
jgi:hypothetical protein